MKQSRVEIKNINVRIAKMGIQPGEVYEEILPTNGRSGRPVEQRAVAQLFDGLKIMTSDRMGTNDGTRYCEIGNGVSLYGRIRVNVEYMPALDA